MQTSRPIQSIAIFPKIQADTASAVYLLKAFGEEYFPGAAAAPVLFWSALPDGKTAEQIESGGCLTIDLGGPFDHHLANRKLGRREECVSTMIAKELGLESHPALKKLLAWAKRDDLEGKGTLSEDALDRAFGLSGIIMNLNREYISTPQKILDIVLPIIDVHVREELRRNVELPNEWAALKQSGKLKTWTLRQGSAAIQVVLVESDNTALPGFLRAAKNADLVIQRRSSGHTNIITKQQRGIDLRPVIWAIREAEAKKAGISLPLQTALDVAGRVTGIDNWYYDDAANTIQNGGVEPKGIAPTILTKEEIVNLLENSISKGSIGALDRKKERERAVVRVSPQSSND